MSSAKHKRRQWCKTKYALLKYTPKPNIRLLVNYYEKSLSGTQRATESGDELILKYNDVKLFFS